MSGDVAVPVALFAVEALTNIFKYAFPTGHDGVVKIDLARTEGGRIKLTISDNGIGFDDEAVTKGGIGIVGVEPERNELERIFLEVTRGDLQ